MATVAEAVVKLSAETANFRRDFAAARAETQSFQQSLIETGKQVVETIAGMEALRIAKEILTEIADAAMEVEQANARLEAVFKATGNAARLSAKDVEDFASAMQNSTLFDDEDVKNAAAALATFQNVQGETFKQAIKLAADMSTIFGGDLQSNAMKLGKALDNPIEGITALQKATGKFTVGEQEHIKTLVEHGHIAEAQAVILQRLTDKVGGASEALAGGDGLTANVNHLHDAWKELRETLGDGFIGTDLSQEAHGFAQLLAQITALINHGTESAADFTKELQDATHVKGLPTITVMGEGPEARKKAAEAAKHAAEETQKEVNKMWRERIADDKKFAEEEASITKWLDEQHKKNAEADTKRAEEKHKDAEKELAWQAQLAQMRYDEEVKQADEVQKVWTHAVQKISDDFAHTFSDLLTGQIKSFKDFAAAILSIWAKTLAQMAGAKLATSLFGGLLSAGGSSSIAPPSFPGLDIPNPLGSSGQTNHVTVNIMQPNATAAQINGAVLGALNGRGMAAAVSRRLGP